MRIAVGFLQTPEGEAALEAAAAEARRRDAELVIVHSTRGGERDEAEELQNYGRELAAIRDRLTDEGLRVDARRFVRGNTPAEDMLELERDEDIDLIVIGIRRRSPVGKLVLGSNSQDIILQASCPVLCVKAGDDW